MQNEIQTAVDDVAAATGRLDSPRTPGSVPLAAAPSANVSSGPAAWQVVGRLPCLKCRYDLLGLCGPTLRCPECGATFNLADDKVLSNLCLGHEGRLFRNWVMAAAACSPLVIMSIVITFDGGGINVVGLTLLGFFGGLWIYFIYRWFRLHTRRLRAFLVLFLLHLAVWTGLGTGVAIVLSLAAFDAFETIQTLGLPGALMFVLLALAAASVPIVLLGAADHVHRRSLEDEWSVIHDGVLVPPIAKFLAPSTGIAGSKSTAGPVR